MYRAPYFTKKVWNEAWGHTFSNQAVQQTDTASLDQTFDLLFNMKWKSLASAKVPSLRIRYAI